MLACPVADATFWAQAPSLALLLAHCRKLALALGTAAGMAGAEGDRESVSPPAMGYSHSAGGSPSSYAAGSLRCGSIAAHYSSSAGLQRSGSGKSAAYAAGKASAAAAAAGISTAAADAAGALKGRLAGYDGDSMSLRKSLGSYK
jgi:hypothetical protein